MKRDIVQVWVLKETKQMIKVLAARQGLSILDYLAWCFSREPEEDGNASTQRPSQANK